MKTIVSAAGPGAGTRPGQRLPFAVVHGRFQPFHNEHLAYCLWALERGDTLVVGITNPDRSSVAPEATSTHRHTAEANPFAYWERALMVRDSLLEAGVPAARFSIVSLPIDAVDRWAEYVPTASASSVHVLRVFSAWEEEKARRLRIAGLRVEAPRPTSKLLSACDVRERIGRDDGAASGPATWEHDVPAATARWIRALDGVRRVHALVAERARMQQQLKMTTESDDASAIAPDVTHTTRNNTAT